MQQTRRTWLRTTGAVLAGAALAGCSGSNDGDDEEEPSSEPDEDPSEGEDPDTSEPEPAFEAADIGVVSEWNAIRTRLRDPLILGHAGEFQAGAGVVGNIFERFETASGEHNAHEALEETNETNYEEFESALSDLSERLEAEDLDGAHDAMRAADQALRGAQTQQTDEETAERLTLLVMGVHVEDAALLLALESPGQAAQEFSQIASKFEEKGLYDMVAEADEETADAFVQNLENAANAAENGETEQAQSLATDAFEAATSGIHALAEESVAGAAHMAALQARGWDGAALAQAGGPSQTYAHAASLNEYRARAREALWLSEAGMTNEAVGVVRGALERFEVAAAHDTLEEADHESYEAFEGGLESLKSAIDAEDSDGAREALSTVDEALRSGIDAMVSEPQHALLEAGYAKIRLEDAVERYRDGDQERAVELAQNVLADFEADAGGFHETLEETDHDLYEAYEHDHLEGLVEAMEAGDDEAVGSHIEGVRETLLDFETTLGSPAAVSGVEAGYLVARAQDAATLAHLGEQERAETVVSDTLAYFEAGAGGFHEAFEEADHEGYEEFEGALEQFGENLDDPELSHAGGVADRAFGGVTDIVGASGANSADATAVLQSVFAHFEAADVHEILEEADHESYEAYEAALDSYIETLESGSGIDSAAETYATATLQAQFAAAGAPDDAPVDAEPAEDEDESEPELEGGPNIVDSVPADADHVVDLQAVAFDPETITVQVGDTVAWEHAAGEPHNVVAYEGEIPEAATYWASGGFESEEAAREGWENGVGAVQEGQAYVHTFETAGEHGYFCVPHEAAGMVGTVVVEE